MPNRHDWNTWQEYCQSHDGHLTPFEQSQFLIDNQLGVPAFDPVLIIWDGRLVCADGIEVHVAKSQETRLLTNGRYQVRTIKYAYQVLRRVGDRALNLFRFDNYHVHADERHPDAHHYHRFNDNGDEILPCMHVGVDRWPVLSDVLKKAETLCQALRKNDETQVQQIILQPFHDN